MPVLTFCGGGNQVLLGSVTYRRESIYEDRRKCLSTALPDDENSVVVED